MEVDSPRPALPLAEAITTWSDPALVEALNAAEAPFAPQQRVQLLQEWVAEIAQYRARGTSARSSVTNPTIRALERAWQKLFVGFNASVAAGDIVLWGRMLKPIARSDAEPLLAAWARELLYLPYRGTVVVGEDAYEDVVVQRRMLAPLVAARLGRVRTARGPISLGAALREWTAPALLGEVCRSERRYTRDVLASFPAHPILSDPADLAKPAKNGWSVGPPSFAALIAAWTALETDFRARLVSGEFHLRGVMTRPQRTTVQVSLPGVWAADYLFDFRREAISVDDARYVAVVATYGAAAEGSGRDVDRLSDAAVPDSATCERTVTEAHAVPPSAPPVVVRKGGRKPVAGIIEDALRRHWDGVFPNGAPARPESWLWLARTLTKRVGRAAMSAAGGFPKEETVRGHLPEIYDRLLVEKGGPRASDQ
ncbi:hypothetical protein [Roseomonas sp. CECT 9278]|uniref:hypothetical protein n=1 Tax=Roseomonas sp. CECT 9278 TaxID=2845823 RepID=UPI001E5E1001|nr:hypothetical protein [Roseomonas sp. CECT 9278]CAH0242978.1 hypothetical protein ROS9278_02943 [Roseomonas sp. CECT 9278]